MDLTMKTKKEVEIERSKIIDKICQLEACDIKELKQPILRNKILVNTLDWVLGNSKTFK